MVQPLWRTGWRFLKKLKIELPYDPSWQIDGETMETVTMNLQMFKLVLEKAEEPEIKLPTSAGSLKKQEFQKNIYFCFISMPEPLTVWITINCGKFFKRWAYQTT